MTTAEMWQQVAAETDAATAALGRLQALLDVLVTRINGLPLAEQDTVAGRAIAALQAEPAGKAEPT